MNYYLKHVSSKSEAQEVLNILHHYGIKPFSKQTDYISVMQGHNNYISTGTVVKVDTNENVFSYAGLNHHLISKSELIRNLTQDCPGVPPYPMTPSYKPLTIETAKVGMRVMRNPETWKLGNQDFDNGQPGEGEIVHIYDPAKFHSYPISVSWDGGRNNVYPPSQLLYDPNNPWDKEEKVVNNYSNINQTTNGKTIKFKGNLPKVRRGTKLRGSAISVRERRIAVTVGHLGNKAISSYI